MWYRILICVPAFLLFAPAQPKFVLSIDNIMRGPALYGYPPQAVRWSGDSQRVYFRWKKCDDPLLQEYSTYVVNRDGSGLRKLNEDEAREAPPAGGDATREWRMTVYESGGDIFLYDNLAGRRRQLTKTADAESDPHFTHDEQRVAFVRNDNLFVLSPGTGEVIQLTDIRKGGKDEDESKGTPSQEFLKTEEAKLFDYIRDKEKKEAEDKARAKRLNPRKPFRLNAKQSVKRLRLSPDESYVLAWIEEAREGSRKTIVPNFVTESGYTADIPSRTDVGDPSSRVLVAFLDVRTGESKWLDDGMKGRETEWESAQWSEDGSRLVMKGRAADNKDVWIAAADPRTAKTRPLVDIHDDAWVDGPAESAYGWLKDSERIYFTWERDGWSHLYTVAFSGGEPKQLTSGKWEVRGVQLTRDRSRFLLQTSETSPAEDHYYLMSTDGGAREKITTMPGGHNATLSPDGTMLADVYSYTNKPPELYLQHPRGKAEKVTSSPAPDFFSYPWLDTPIVWIPTRDGAKTPAHLYKPAKWKSGGGLVIFVHGAGYLQNVTREWSYYGREYMFHHLLRERGYMVLDLDYRGSAGYGRDWRTAIYRHMGGKDLDDQVDAVKWAVKEYGVDPKRVGIYGGSYGGFITLMAMFTQPDVFAAGASLRPVTDWAHYNHEYTSNILNSPQKDAEAYRLSSPIYHAAGLKGALLICHGMVDTNVHFQDSVRLAQRLIELRKENWELAVYPVENHGFVQPSSWADEYKRILKLFEENLRR
ncbi:MAG: Dipeptidyl aminopeptidase 4 [Bryobacteraceae bacterium]|nr:Dipeptidyl aminopeptidase 4 [Bryobacteraceae bacterium]